MNIILQVILQKETLSYITELVENTWDENKLSKVGATQDFKTKTFIFSQKIHLDLIS